MAKMKVKVMAKMETKALGMRKRAVKSNPLLHSPSPIKKKRAIDWGFEESSSCRSNGAAATPLRVRDHLRLCMTPISISTAEESRFVPPSPPPGYPLPLYYKPCPAKPYPYSDDPDDSDDEERESTACSPFQPLPLPSSSSSCRSNIPPAPPLVLVRDHTGMVEEEDEELLSTGPSTTPICVSTPGESRFSPPSPPPGFPIPLFCKRPTKSFSDSDDDDADSEEMKSTASSAFAPLPFPFPLPLPLVGSAATIPPSLAPLPLPLPPLCYEPSLSFPSSASPTSQGFRTQLHPLTCHLHVF